MQTPVGLCLQGIGRSQDSASLGPEGGMWGWVGRRRLRAARGVHGSTPAVDLGAMKLSRYQAIFLTHQAGQPKVEVTPSGVKL